MSTPKVGNDEKLQLPTMRRSSKDEWARRSEPKSLNSGQLDSLQIEENKVSLSSRDNKFMLFSPQPSLTNSFYRQRTMKSKAGSLLILPDDIRGHHVPTWSLYKRGPFATVAILT